MRKSRDWLWPLTQSLEKEGSGRGAVRDDLETTRNDSEWRLAIGWLRTRMSHRGYDLPVGVPLRLYKKRRKVIICIVWYEVCEYY